MTKNSSALVLQHPQALQNPATYIGERLRLARNIRNLTLENLASNLGITRKQLQNYETAQCSLSAVRLLEIAQLLEIAPSFFMDGLTPTSNLLNNDELRLVQKFRKIKCPQTKASILGILNEI